MKDWHLWLAILALAGVTVFTRGVFLLPRREPRLPGWVSSGLRHAPLAALMAVVVPEVARGQGLSSISSWHDPRWLAAAVSVAWFCWRRGVTEPVVVGSSALVLFQYLARA